MRIREQSYLNRRHAHERSACVSTRVQAWTHVDSKSLCHTLSTIEPRRTSNFVCYRTNFPSKRIIRVSGLGRKSIRFFSQNKNIIPCRPDKQGHCASVTTQAEKYLLRLSRDFDKFNFRISYTCDEFFHLCQNVLPDKTCCYNKKKTFVI